MGGVTLFQEKKYAEALVLFQNILLQNNADNTAALYIKRCQKKLEKKI